MSLKKKELMTMAELIHLVDVVECYGVRDCLELEHLANKATEEEYRKAVVIAYGGKP